MPYTPLSIVARINNQAKKEISVKGVDSEDMEDIRTHTGYSDILQLDTPNDLLSRDRRTISITPLPAADSFNLIVEGERVFFLVTEF